MAEGSAPVSSRRNDEPHLGSFARCAADLQICTDEQRALAHPADPGAIAVGIRTEAGATVSDDELGCFRPRPQLELGLLGARVPHHVRERLLGHPIDDQLRLRTQRRKIRVDVAGDPNRRAPGDRVRQRRKRGGQAQVVERLRPQALRDLPYRLERPAQILASRGHLVPSHPGARTCRLLELEHDRSQSLADLVVQLARDPQALPLLRGQRSTGALPPLRLEPANHVVDGVGHLGHLWIGATDVRPLARSQRIHLTREASQPREGLERAPEQHEVHGEHDAKTEHEHNGLRQGEREAHRRGGKGERRRSDRKHQRVREEDPPQKRHAGSVCPPVALLREELGPARTAGDAGRLRGIVNSMVNDPFKALSHPIRRGIVERLAEGPATVGEATGGIGVSKPAISKHLKVLEETGVVKRVVEGRTHLLSLQPDVMSEAADWMDRQRALWGRLFDVVDEYLKEQESP